MQGPATTSAFFESLFPAWREDRVIFANSDLAVVCKPPGMSSQPNGREDDAQSRLSRSLRQQGEPSDLRCCQPLERDTSGLLTFARTKEASARLIPQFQARESCATYVAAVAGALAGDSGRARAHADGPLRDARAQETLAPRYRVLWRSENRSLVEITCDVRAAGEVRRDLDRIGVRIAGCRVYGGAPAHRLLLHLAALRLRDPRTQQAITFTSPTPACFAEWVTHGCVLLPSDAEAIERRMREALDLRYGIAHEGGTTAFRLVHGDGDGLPGVDVDVYGDHLVVGISTDEAKRNREAVLDAAGRLGASGVYLKVRPKHASVIVDSRSEDFAPETPCEGPQPQRSSPYTSRAAVPRASGRRAFHGVFLDQRENRRRVRSQAKDARVLNLFSYTGAFTVAAVAGGARSTLSIDVSRGATAWARENLDLIDANPASHQLLEADVLLWLEGLAAAEPPFDLIVLDPPSFATTKKSRFRADADYRRVAALVIGKLATGGSLWRVRTIEEYPEPSSDGSPATRPVTRAERLPS